MDDQTYHEVQAEDGTTWGVETTGMWDDPRDGPIRLIVSVFRRDPDGGWSPELGTGHYVKHRDGRVSGDGED